ncbi:PH domain-containing protein [Putridiphycobacter roseus]|nr:PH domain-containing protein [Putridiphycobacter roseus]
MKVPSRRDNFFRFLIFGSITLIIIPLIVIYSNEGFSNSFFIASVLLMLIAGFILWMWHSTFYEVKENKIFYQSGPIKGKLPIENIQTIQLNKTALVGLKIGMARKGMIIQSTSHNDLYITPSKANIFLKEILKINPNIQVTI